MITPRGTLRLLGLALSIFALSSSLTALAAEPARTRYANARAVGQAAPRASGQPAAKVVRPQAKSRSLVAQAARGEALSEPPQESLDGSLVRGKVRQVGFLEDYGAGCGKPVCDCGGYGAEPACGIEPDCGVELGPRPTVLEPGCGYEPSCGVEGCTACGPTGEVACGSEPLLVGGPDCGSETACDGSCDTCREGTTVDCFPLFLPILRVNWCRFDFFAGVQGFTGPMNYATAPNQNDSLQRGSGSFGFYEGLNEGRSLKPLLGWDMAGQFGVRATQSNLSGAEMTSETRHQVFLTGGVFRRVDYGLQYGLVLDYLNEDWYFQGDLTQLRGELSWKTRGCHTFGFHYMAGLGDDTSDTFVDDGTGTLVRSSVTFEPIDQYRFFYRRLMSKNSSWQGFAGWTDDDHGIVGADLNLALRHNLALQSSATYLIPGEEVQIDEHESEGWNISLGLVWRPGGFEGCGRYCRPMFNVADNGTFIAGKR